MAHLEGPLVVLRDRLATLPPPVIVYNKSHSGSRLLARALREQGVFMGVRRNESEDALPLVPLVEYLVNRYYPDYGRLWRAGSAEGAEAAAAAERAFEDHLEGFSAAACRGWGFKLCEALYALPVLDFLLPRARVVHLVRDGRDVAWSNHVAPELSFWRKVYFNTDRIRRWRSLWLTNRAYERRPHVYNAVHWVNSVETGRAYGTMLRERYAQLRYEDLCADFRGTLRTLLAELSLTPDEAALRRLAPEVRSDSVGKHRQHPGRAQREVLEIVEPTLRSLGYEVEEPFCSRGRLGRVFARLTGA